MYSGTLESHLGHAAQQQQSQHHGDFVLQKYLLLQNQHDELQQHMHELCPLYTTANASSTAVTSPSSSPTRMLNPRSSNSSISSASSTGSLSPPRSRQHRRRSSIPPASNSHSSGVCGVYSQLAPVLDEEVMHEMAADEQMLCDVNEGIKRALTELLNCDKVRQDRAMRSWVQTRLMDTERELRTGRRRRSNGGPVDY